MSISKFTEPGNDFKVPVDSYRVDRVTLEGLLKQTTEPVTVGSYMRLSKSLRDMGVEIPNDSQLVQFSPIYRFFGGSYISFMFMSRGLNVFHSVNIYGEEQNAG